LPPNATLRALTTASDMRRLFENLFAPLLTYLEQGDEPVTYRPSYRTILKAVSALFLALSTALLALVFSTQQLGILLPCLVFFAVGTVALAVAILGSDRAVGRLWRNR